MLTIPDNLIFLHMLGDDIQNESFHHLSRDGGEADRSIITQVLLLALFEDWSDICFPPVLRHLSRFPRLGKDDGERSSNDLSQLPQHPPGPTDLWMSRLPNWSLTQFPSNEANSFIILTSFGASGVRGSSGQPLAE